jgi:hypothetical protein
VTSGGDDDDPVLRTGSTTVGTPPPPAGVEGLAVGIAERNANLLWAQRRGGDFEPWRARVEALRPAYYRLMIDWSQLQPRRGEPPRFEQHDNGCLRDLPPCGAFAGVRDVLRAVRSQQREHGGWEVVVQIFGVPEWAARAPGGCERSTELPRSRPITRRGLEGYRALVRDLVRLAGEEDVELKWWSPWNEPNQPYFLSPQRRRCDASAPSRAPRVYSHIVRALRAELAATPQDERLVLGELAGASGPKPLVTGVAEFVRALPDADACAGDVWAQHQYAERDEEAAARTGAEGADDDGFSGDATDAVTELRRALDERGCTRGKPIWVTETGVGGAHVGAHRSHSRRELAADCDAIAGRLTRWRDDPRVDAAFQFSIREDFSFPVGLFDTGLTRAYPVYDLWRGIAGGRVRCPG